MTLDVARMKNFNNQPSSVGPAPRLSVKMVAYSEQEATLPWASRLEYYTVAQALSPLLVLKQYSTASLVGLSAFPFILRILFCFDK